MIEIRKRLRFSMPEGVIETAMQPLNAPESVDDSQDGEAGGDDDEALVLRGRPLRRDVLMLAPADTIIR